VEVKSEPENDEKEKEAEKVEHSLVEESTEEMDINATPIKEERPDDDGSEDGVVEEDGVVLEDGQVMLEGVEVDDLSTMETDEDTKPNISLLHSLLVKVRD